ncbi:MAG: extracellular solute-binding protein, partial [Propionibacteriaceae bacterium]|nr:extracellular solute-binding protein [Propionibacteriaceae bacterium]
MNYSLHRRGFLKGALAAGALIPLAACAGGDKTTDPAATTPGTDPATTTQADPDNPFGLAIPSEVDAAIFNGGYGVAYAEFAAAMVGKLHDGVTVNVTKIQDATKELQPRFAGGDPPDVIDNAGAGKIGLSAIISQLEDLNDVVDSNNYEGEVIRDTLFAGVLEPGTIDDKLAVINYVLTVYGVWYSASLFKENGWEPPKTWDDAIALGAKAKEKGKYLFLWGVEAADYYMEMCITSAIKEGGDEVRLALDNLEEGCWSKPALQDVFGKLEEIVKAGYIKPGGGGTQ